MPSSNVGASVAPPEVKPMVGGPVAATASGNSAGPIVTPGAGKSHQSRSVAMDSFQLFKKQAKEKADKQRVLKEQQELRKRQNEHAERERLRVEQEKRQQKEEEEALEKARRSMMADAKPAPVAAVVK